MPLLGRLLLTLQMKIIKLKLNFVQELKVLLSKGKLKQEILKGEVSVHH